MKNLGNGKMLRDDLLNSIEERLIQNLVERIISDDEFINQVAKKIIEEKKEEKEFYLKDEICLIYRISPAKLERMVRDGLKYKNNGANTTRLFTKKDFETYITQKR